MKHSCVEIQAMLQEEEMYITALDVPALFGYAPNSLMLVSLLQSLE